MRTKIILNLMLVSFLLGCSDMGEEVIDYHNKILFSSSRSGKEQLYMMNPDGTGIRQLTSGPYWNGAGRWSPDAKQIVFNSEEGSTTAGFSIFLMNIDGTGRRPLGKQGLFPLWGSLMSWSPDGKKIAFSYCPSCELYDRSHYIYVINVDGTNFVQLTHDRGVQDDGPVWAPDGNTLYFYSNRHQPDSVNSEIYRIKIDGSGLERITFTPNGYSVLPAFSPGGNMVAFVSTRGGVWPPGVFVMNADGTGVRLIVRPPNGEVFNYPRWSPDGQRITFVSGVTDGTQRTYVYTVAFTGSNLTRLASNDATANWPDWSW